MVDCYAELACTDGACVNSCNYSAPTTDAVVMAAGAVFACLCGG